MQIVIDIDDDTYRVVKNELVIISGMRSYKTAFNKILDAIVNGKSLPQNATNGDMMKAIFPQINVIKSNVYPDSYHVSLPDFSGVYILKCWWNAPYREDKGE